MATAVRPTTEPFELSTTAPTVAGRVVSVDVLRGLVMVIMALDHVRDYFTNVRFQPEDPTQTTLALFFTRWITHLCAPTFVFLAGVGAGLSAARGKPRGALARFLVTRGIWLLIAEVTIIRLGWTFNLDYANQTWVQVIWALGWSMIVLAGLVYLPRPVIAVVAIGMIVGHNLLDGIGLETTAPTLVGASPRDWIWAILHVQRPPVIYPLVPWIGVMAAGYLFAPWLLLPDPPRRRRLLQFGAALMVAFVVLRAGNVYGDPRPWSTQSSGAMTLVSFLGTQKYPPSLLYLLMTLGPAIMLLAAFDQARGKAAMFLDTIGRVPFFYYVLHIYLIHTMQVVVLMAQGYPSSSWGSVFFTLPQGWGFGLPVVYLMWVLALVILYPACRWFAGVKERRRDLWWLGYL